jgi:hypothetical protein
MNAKQAKTLPVGIRVSFASSEPYLIDGDWTSRPRGTVLANDPKAGNGFLVKWDDGQEGWIDYQGATDLFVPGLKGTRTP